MGCGVGFVVNGNNVVEIAYDTDNPINFGSLCPRGHDLLGMLTNPGRLSIPSIKINNEAVNTTWEAALKELASQLGKVAGHEVGVLISGHASLEELEAAAKFCAETIQTPYFEIEGVQTALVNPDYALFAQIPALETMVILGDVLEKTPCFSRSINAVKYGKKGNQIIVIDESASHTSWFATQFFKAPLTTKDGAGQLPAELTEALAAAEKILSTAQSGMVVVSSPNDDPQLEAIGWQLAQKTGKKYLCFHTASNTYGARQTLQKLSVRAALAGNKLKVLLALGAGLEAEIFPKLNALTCLVAADLLETDLTQQAHIVFPVAMPQECGGSFIFCGEQLRTVVPVVQPFGGAGSYVKIFNGLTKPGTR